MYVSEIVSQYKKIVLSFFRTFADADNVQRALENCPHNLDGRTIDPKYNVFEILKNLIIYPLISDLVILARSINRNARTLDIRKFSSGVYRQMSRKVICAHFLDDMDR